MNEAGFLLTGDDFDGRAEGGGGAGGEFVLVIGVAHGGGGDGTDGEHVVFGDDLGEAGELGGEKSDGGIFNAARAEDAFTEACYFTFGGERAEGSAGGVITDEEADRVASNVDSGVARHLGL